MWRLIPLLVGTGAMGFGFLLCAATASSMLAEYRPFKYSKEMLRNIVRDGICLLGGASSMVCGSYVIADVLLGWLS